MDAQYLGINQLEMSTDIRDYPSVSNGIEKYKTDHCIIYLIG